MFNFPINFAHRKATLSGNIDQSRWDFPVLTAPLGLDWSPTLAFGPFWCASNIPNQSWTEVNPGAIDAGAFYFTRGYPNSWMLDFRENHKLDG